MAQPMPTTGALAWGCSLWTLRKMDTRSPWLTTRARQVWVQAAVVVEKGWGRLPTWKDKGSLSRPGASIKSAHHHHQVPSWSSSQPHEARRASPTEPPILQMSEEPRARNQARHLEFELC